MALNDAYIQTATAVADAGDFIIDPTAAGTGAAEVFELGGDAAAEIYREVDPDDDGTYEVSVLIDTLDPGPWHTQDNEFVVSSSENTRIRVNNISGGSGNYFAAGMEVSD